MTQGFMINVVNVLGPIEGQSVLIVPQVNPSFSAQPTSPVILSPNQQWGNQYVEADGSNNLPLLLYSNSGSGFNCGNVQVVFDSKETSYFPNGQVYVNSFEPLQMTANVWMYPFMQMAALGGSYNWTLGMLYLIPTLDPTNIPVLMSDKPQKTKGAA